jgi:tRNA (guanine26-N2/guanine27-N2)-dimethyltransferase
VLLARCLARSAPLRVLDLMAGSGVRSLRYGLEGEASEVWANDADPDRLPLLRANLAALPEALVAPPSALTAQRLLASLIAAGERRELIDLDAFGYPGALLPAALECVALGGVLYLASTDGRGPTGHDRPMAVRRYGSAARAHPAPWELALRLQLAAVARAAWAQGRGIQPLFAFSEGRTFRTAVRIERLPARREEEQLGLLAHCHGCGEQLLQPLLRLGRWPACACPGEAPLAVSGPLWIGPLQDPGWLKTMAAEAAGSPQTLSPAAGSLLARLMADPGMPARVWPTALIARQLGQGPPPLRALVAALRAEGHQAEVSGVMAGQLRSDAPWPAVLAAARALARRSPASEGPCSAARTAGLDGEPDLAN